MNPYLETRRSFIRNSSVSMAAMLTAGASNTLFAQVPVE